MQRLWAEHAEALADWSLTNVIGRRDVYCAYDAEGRPRTASNLTREVLIGHFRGEQIVAVHTTNPESRVRGVTIDVDCHGEDADGSVARRNWDFVLEKADRLRGLGLEILLTASDGRGGYHLRGWFDHLVDAEVAHWLGHQLIADHEQHGLERPPEVFPKQARLGPGRPYGNAVRLPGRHHRHRDYWSIVVDPEAAGFCFGEVAIGRILRLRGGDPGRILELFREQGPARAPRIAHPGVSEAAGRSGGESRGAPPDRTLPGPEPGEIESLLDRLPA